MSLLVKICGLTRFEDAKLAVEFGANMLGFIFAKSPRQISAEKVRDIILKLKGSKLLLGIETVGVFVNEKPSIVKEILDYTKCNTAQLHGDETLDECDKNNFIWYKALRAKSNEDLILSCKNPWTCSRLLVDYYSKDAYGGTGKNLDLDLALLAKSEVKKAGKIFILAGGLNPENVLTILNTVHPDAIDVSSGIEESYGIKSASKLHLLFDNIKKYREEPHGKY